MRLILICAILAVSLPSSLAFLSHLGRMRMREAKTEAMENRVDENVRDDSSDGKPEVKKDSTENDEDVDEETSEGVYLTDDDQGVPEQNYVETTKESSEDGVPDAKKDSEVGEHEETTTKGADSSEGGVTWIDRTTTKTKSDISEIEGPRNLLSFHGTFLRARNSDRDSVRVDLAYRRNACERWNIEEFNYRQVAIKSYCTPGGFLRANATGAVDVTDRLVDEALWTPYKNEGGTWSLKSYFGKWLSARRDGNVKTMDRCDSWEYFWIESFP